MMRLATIAVMVWLACAPSPLVTAQPTVGIERDTLEQYFEFKHFSPLSCLITWLPPFFARAGLEMKEFIRGESLRLIREGHGDVRAVDAIFIRAMNVTSGNTAIALFLSTVATFDHRVVGFRLPFFRFFFPLTNESAEEFAGRVSALPSRIYPDSPGSKAGDRDKLQHFFGSAFMTYLWESDGAAERIGYFVEQGEEAFVVDGALDERDSRANRHGQHFALALLAENGHLPSEYLHFGLAADTLTEQSICGQR